MKRRCALAASVALLALPGMGRAQGPVCPDGSDTCERVAPRTGHDLSLLPFVFYAPETSVAFAGAAVWVYRAPDAAPGAHPSSARIGGLYTLRNQFSFGQSSVFSLDHDDWRISTSGGVTRWPNDFYGFGNDSPESAREVYTAWGYGVRARSMHRVTGPLFIGPQIGVNDFIVTRYEEGGELEKLTIPGSEDHLRVEVGGIVEWDTRDDAFAPRRGALYIVDLGANTRYIGADYDYVRAELDLRQFVHLPWLDQVLALRAFLSTGVGTTPVTEIPTLGGESALRGVYEPRFRDKTATYAVVELRSPLFWRFGGVVFGGAGQVQDTVADLRADALKPAGGAGLRFALTPPERINLRFDLGLGPDLDLQPYFTIGEAF